MQPSQQQKPGLIGATLHKIEQAARSAAPGLTQQMDKLLATAGLGPTMAPVQHGTYYQQHTAAAAFPNPYQQSSWPYVQPGPGYPAPQAGHSAWPQSQPPAAYPQPYAYRPTPAPVTQVYPPPAAYVSPPAHAPASPANATPVQWQQLPSPPWPHAEVRYAPSPNWQQPNQEIPIIEATVDIKPSGLPVWGTPVASRGVPAAACVPPPSDTQGAAAAASSPQQQQQQGFHQQLQQLWVSAVPATAQGAAAAGVAGTWYHQDAGWLSELTLMSDGRFYWNRSSTSSGGDRSTSAGAYPASSPAAAAAAAASGPGPGPAGSNSKQEQQQRTETWHGIWKVEEGSRGTGKLNLVYITEQQQQQQQQQDLSALSGTQQQQQQQQQRSVSYQRSALDDTLVLDGLAHVKLGPA